MATNNKVINMLLNGEVKNRAEREKLISTLSVDDKIVFGLGLSAKDEARGIYSDRESINGYKVD